MADPRKTKPGKLVSVRFEGRTVVGTFKGILPARSNGKNWRERSDRLIVASESGGAVEYVPYVEGTTFKVVR